MQIDWVTVIAQIVNFLVLIWLLQRVLYRPLTRALKAREEEVNRTLREAEAAREDAEAEAQAHREAQEALQEAREARLDEAREEAEALRRTMTEEAREDLATRRQTWQAQLEDEKAAFLDRLRRRAGEAFVTLARRALSDMADEDLVDRIAHVFARRLSSLDDAEQTQLRSALRRDKVPVISSSFPLSDDARDRVGKAVAGLLGREAETDFREDDAIECGIVLAVGSRHVGWTLGEHLDALEEDVAHLLDTRADPAPESA